MIRISNIKIYEDIPDDKVINIALNKYKIKQEDIMLCKISKKSVDARKKDDVHYSYSIDLKLKLSFDYLLKSYDFFEDRFEEY